MHCGVGDYTSSLANALCDSGKVQVGVLTGQDGLSSRSEVDLIHGPGWRLRSAIEVLRVVAEWKPDLVHVQYPTRGYGGHLLPWFLPLLLRVAGFRVVQTWHELLPMFAHAYSFLLAVAAKTVIVVRPHYTENISSWYRWLTRKVNFAYLAGAASLPRTDLSESQRSQLHAELAMGSKNVVTYFGFATPNKGMEQLFAIADPARDRLVLVCDLLRADEYQRTILEAAAGPAWKGKVTITGFLPARRVSDVLAVSDAVVLPFPGGGGDWNSSVAAAQEQGTLVITTSGSKEGYDPIDNTFYGRPGDVESLARALATYAGRKTEAVLDRVNSWARIAEEHVRIYDGLIRANSGG